MSRHFDDLDAVLEFDALDDFRQLIFTLQSSPRFRGGIEKFESRLSVTVLQSLALRCNGTVTRFNHVRVVDVQVSDRLVDADRPHLPADDRHLEHLIGRNHLRIIPSRCRRSGFAVFQAFERDNNAIGLQQDLSRFHVRLLTGAGTRRRPAPVEALCYSVTISGVTV